MEEELENLSGRDIFAIDAYLSGSYVIFHPDALSQSIALKLTYLMSDKYYVKYFCQGKVSAHELLLDGIDPCRE